MKTKIKLKSELIDKCLTIATVAHKGQVDKGGRPLIEHSIAVAEQLDTEETICAALLHDVIEDTSLTVRDLLELGIPSHIVYTIAILTRTDDETYKEYILRIASDPEARQVKMADLRHNMDLSRLKEITPADIERRKKRYEPAYQLLQDAEAMGVVSER